MILTIIGVLFVGYVGVHVLAHVLEAYGGFR